MLKKIFTYFSRQYFFNFSVLIICCLYTLPTNFCLAQNQLSTLIQDVEKPQPYSQKIKKMILLSRLYRESDSKKAVEYALKTIKLAEQNNDSISLARIYAVYATTVSVQGNYPLDLKYLNKAIQVIKNKNDNFSLAFRHFLFFLRTDYENLVGNKFFPEKELRIKKALEIYLKTNDTLGLADSYYCYAQTLFHKADLLKGTLKYGPQNEISKSFLQQIKPEQLYNDAIIFNKKAFDYYNLAGMVDRKAGCITEIARIKLVLKEYNNVSILLDSAIKIHQFENGIIGEGTCNMLYSVLYKDQNKLPQALLFAQKALQLYLKTNYNLEVAIVLRNIASIYEKQNNFKKALEFHLQAIQYQEKSYNENTANSLFEIQNNFENQLKNSTIQKLKSEQKLAKLEKQQTLNYILGAAFVVFILIIAAVFLYLFKERSLKEARKNYELTQLLNSSLTQKVNEAELTAMRAEMNPHFVFNTMNSIQGLIVSNRQSEAISYLNDFSRLSRRILDQSTSKYIKFSEEIAFLKNYLAIESLRFEDVFSVKWNIDKSIVQDELEIPPMLIQPFLENAIKHGLLPKQKHGIIEIRFENRENESMLYCEITDNGVGRNSTQTIPKTHNSKGIAITEKRLELLNNNENESETYTFTIVDLKDSNGNSSGTQVQLFIPYLTL